LFVILLAFLLHVFFSGRVSFPSIFLNYLSVVPVQIADTNILAKDHDRIMPFTLYDFCMLNSMRT
jgi:hypothetical protein